MLSPVAHAIEQVRQAFAPSDLVIEEDGSGGAYVIIEVVDLGPKFTPQQSWLGGHITAQAPYSDVYPLYASGGLVRTDGRPFQAPLSLGHQFRGRPALQISRKSNRFDPALQTPASKFVKVLHYLRNEV
jgi:hypothetical protein